MSSDNFDSYRRVQVKVLYSFNNDQTVFLSRSRSQHSVKVVQIPSSSDTQEDEFITLGAFELKSSILQILRSSPENFNLDEADYAVYYKDVTEQPDEPFVSQGVLSQLVQESKSNVIPGRICQNLSASYLFGDKGNVSSLTLELRLKLHAIDKTVDYQAKSMDYKQTGNNNRRPSEMQSSSQKRQKKMQPMINSDAIKATRTKSLPIFYHPPNSQIFNIINADKSGGPSKFDSKSVQDRFKSAPFMQAKIIDNPRGNKRSRTSTRLTPEPQRAMRTRSVMSSKIPIVSSPIQEESSSDATDDTEYQENKEASHPMGMDKSISEEDSPYTPNDRSYRSVNQFQALPDLEDLDSRKTHAIPDSKLPKDHNLICTNSNCATSHSKTWRYFETGIHPNYLAIHRATEFNEKHYEGMFGPLCNACYLFLRNKGFMRPEGVVKKYLQQQRYKKELKQKEENVNLLSEDKNTISEQVSRTTSSPHHFLTPSHTPAVINQVIQNNLNNHSNIAVLSDNKSKSPPKYDDIHEFMHQLNAFGGPLTDIDPIPQDSYQGKTPPIIATKSNTRVINIGDDDDDDKENCPPSMSIAEESASIKGSTSHLQSNLALMEDSLPSSDHSTWMTNLFGEPTPIDTPKMINESGTQNASVSANKEPKENIIDENSDHKDPRFPKLSTFVSFPKKVPERAQHLNVPSSPFFASRNERSNFEIDEANDAHIFHQSNFNPNDVQYMEEQDLFANRNFSSSPGQLATRNDTTMSWSAKQRNSGNQIESISSPNTDFLSHDDPQNGTMKNAKDYSTINVQNPFSSHK